VSTSTSITITPLPEGFIPSEGILVDLLQSVAPGVLDNSESWQRPELFTGEDGSSSWSVGAQNKWGIDGVNDFALLVSENYPVQVEVESSGMEDDAWQDVSVFVGGKLTEFSELEMTARLVKDGEVVQPDWELAKRITENPWEFNSDEIRAAMRQLLTLAGAPA
jgi:hypothetical protein